MSAEVEALRSRVAALEDLLDVHERISLEHARRLEQALAEQVLAREQLQAQAAELEMQAEELQAQAAQLEETQAELEMANDELQRSNDELLTRGDALERAKQQMESAIDSKGRFYASMSHELRTPINAILGYTDLLLAGVFGDLAPPQLESIQKAHRATRHLLDLVNDVLDLSKIEAGKLEIQWEETSLHTLVEELLETMRPVAEERGCELVFFPEVEADGITTDPRRVRQILLNLISNAIKFGECKPVHVRCGATAGTVFIEVIDQGDGIAPADLNRIFEEFVQLSGKEQQGGTGLGLAISNRLAMLLGGGLEVESSQGGGSTFRLVLPIPHPGSAMSAGEVEPALPG